MISAIRAAAVSACLFAASPVIADGRAPGAEAAAGEKLKIFDAEYGDQASRRLCDATAVIAALCDGHESCAFPVGNALCGDPAFGTPKKLHMAFKCEGGAPLLILAQEPTVVRLSCAPPPKAPGRDPVGDRRATL